MNRQSMCVGGAPADIYGVCSEHGETACVIEVAAASVVAPPAAVA